jgi:hypothetical protein
MEHRAARRRVAAALLIALIAGGGAARAAEVPPERVVEYARDALTVRLTKAPLGEVLAEIGRQSGAEIHGQPRDVRELTVTFEAVPLPEALHRLLGDQNFALVYGDGGRLRAVKLLGGPQAPAAAPAPPSPPPPPVASGASPVMLVGLLQRHPPVPVGPKLTPVLGTERATLLQLVETGLHNDDPAVRLEAIRVTLEAVETEPELRAGLLAAVNGLQPGEMTGMMRGAAGDRAEEIATHVATQARSLELRAKAATLLQQLRGARPGS